MSNDSALSRFFKKHLIMGIKSISYDSYDKDTKEPLVTLIGGLEDDISEMSALIDKMRDKYYTGIGNDFDLICEELERLCEQARSREL